MKRHNNPKRGQDGFSLIEVLVAVTIIALMAGLVAVNVFGAFSDSQRDKASIEIETLRQSVKMFQLKERRLPLASEWQDFLFKGSKSHPKPYLDTDKYPDNEILDPWGNRYQYKVSDGKFEIISYGEDGQPGGEGDAADVSSIAK